MIYRALNPMILTDLMIYINKKCNPDMPTWEWLGPNLAEIHNYLFKNGYKALYGTHNIEDEIKIVNNSSVLVICMKITNISNAGQSFSLFCKLDKSSWKWDFSLGSEAAHHCFPVESDLTPYKI